MSPPSKIEIIVRKPQIQENFTEAMKSFLQFQAIFCLKTTWWNHFDHERLISYEITVKIL